MPTMCKSKFNGSGILTFEAVAKPIEQARLARVPFVAGGFIFGARVAGAGGAVRPGAALRVPG